MSSVKEKNNINEKESNGLGGRTPRI